MVLAQRNYQDSGLNLRLPTFVIRNITFPLSLHHFFEKSASLFLSLSSSRFPHFTILLSVAFLVFFFLFFFVLLLWCAATHCPSPLIDELSGSLCMLAYDSQGSFHFQFPSLHFFLFSHPRPATQILMHIFFSKWSLYFFHSFFQSFSLSPSKLSLTYLFHFFPRLGWETRSRGGGHFTLRPLITDIIYANGCP